MRYRYRTTQVTPDTTRATKNKRVVAFMVTVQLVEKSVNRRVGTDIVVSLRLQYKIVERRWRRNRINLPMSPNQEDEPCVSTSVPAWVAIVAKAAAELSIVERPSVRVAPPLLALEGSMLLGYLYSRCSIGSQLVSPKSMRRFQPSILPKILIPELQSAYG